MPDSRKLVALIRQWMESFTVRSMKEGRSYVREAGLSMPQHVLLMHLHHHGGYGVRDVSRHMDITSAAASQLIEKLVKAGLVERTEDPTDRRARRIALSLKGRTLLEKSFDERYRWVKELAARLTSTQRDAVFKVLPILIAAEKKLAEAGPRRTPAPGKKPSRS